MRSRRPRLRRRPWAIVTVGRRGTRRAPGRGRRALRVRARSRGPHRSTALNSELFSESRLLVSFLLVRTWMTRFSRSESLPCVLSLRHPHGSVRREDGSAIDMLPLGIGLGCLNRLS